MKIVFNELGVIDSFDQESDLFNQGAVGIVLKAKFNNIDNYNYVAFFNFTRSDGSKVTRLVMDIDNDNSDSYRFTFNDEWFFALDGLTSFTIFLENSAGEIIANGKVDFTINKNDYDGTETTITITQYDTLISSLAGKLDKKTNATETSQVYVKTTSGLQGMVDIASSVRPNAIVRRNSRGFFNVDEPTEDSHPTSKKYVDDSLSLKADLDNGKVPSSQLPSYVDDLMTFYSFSNPAPLLDLTKYATEEDAISFGTLHDYIKSIFTDISFNSPNDLEHAEYIGIGFVIDSNGVFHYPYLVKVINLSGNYYLKYEKVLKNVIYLNTTNNLTYRYNGLFSYGYNLNDVLVEISSSLALGETSSTAYAGDKGKANAENIEQLKDIVSDINIEKGTGDYSIVQKTDYSYHANKAIQHATIALGALSEAGMTESEFNEQFKYNRDGTLRDPIIDDSGEQYETSESYAVAIGDSAKAKDRASFSMGMATQAWGAGAQALGNHTIARANFSTAIGNHTNAGVSKYHGEGSFAQGYYTSATYNYSSSFGFYTQTLLPNSQVVGQYNKLSGEYISTALFSVGTGTGTDDSNRRTTFSVTKDNKVVIADSNAQLVNTGNSLFYGDAEFKGICDFFGDVYLLSEHNEIGYVEFLDHAFVLSNFIDSPNSIVNKDYVDTSLIAIKDKLFEVIATTLEEDITSDAYVVPSAIDSHPIIEGVPFELKGVSGNSRQFNQLVKDGNFVDSSNWKVSNGNLSISNNVASLIPSAINSFIYQTINILTNHKYLIKFKAKGGAENENIFVVINGIGINGTDFTTQTTFETYNVIITPTNSGDFQLRIGQYSPQGSGIDIKEVQLFDLTLMYGVGNEPTTIDEFNALYPLEYYEYNEGKIKSTTLSKIESREQYVSVDLGTLNYSYDSTNNRFYLNPYTQLPNMKVVKDYSTIPNFVCSLYKPTTINDFDNNITDMSIRGHTSLNGWFAIRNTNYTDATEFKNAMSGVILKYQSINPNDAPLIKTINLPNAPITLNGINDIKDILTFEEQEDETYNAVITRKVGTYTFDGTETIYIAGAISSGLYRYYYSGLSSIMKSGTALNGICDKYPTDKLDWNTTTTESVRFGQKNDVIYFYLINNYSTSAEVSSYLNGTTVYYELAEPTTETIATGLSFEDISSLFEIGGTIVNDNENTNYNIQATTTIDIVCKDWSI